MPRALISVSDKVGLVDLAKVLSQAGVELISTGGTAKALREAGLDVKDISEITGFPEMMDGRVKTLHPKVHGGLLYVRGNAEHEKQAADAGIGAIDYVIVNLYPFEATIRRPGVELHEAIENIDIGGPSMLRSAAKNYASVTVVVDPSDYSRVAAQVTAEGKTTPLLRAELAAKVFTHTSHYDGLIASYLGSHLPVGVEPTDERFTIPLRKAQSLRYGENPHQKAALYGRFFDSFEQLHGKELSYNNLLDIDASAKLIAEFNGSAPTVAILKHTNPCGVGSAASLAEAWDRAYATDKQAPFGGIIVVNRPLDLPVAEAISEIFSEVIVAPSFEPAALDLLKKKKNLRLIVNRWLPHPALAGTDIRSIVGGSFLLQEADDRPQPEADFKVVTKRQPTAEELDALRFGWHVVRHVKSNAIVYSGAGRTLGIGAGQMSRVDSSKIAVWKAGEAGLSLKGSIVASDAFFPFPDGLIAAAEAGATAAIQPGGSVRDAEVIAAADERGLAMIFTGRRHFRH
ncbi:phosphoribosylaminoimidazolecarboxamide formyltransferase / IMP cyclohydrolase [Verrucomicrobium sp. GAS474]|uniref:bifunctional phosphoribosylaminoimidazolecarboxamide formyltransferase/IMP cyclohydrolase n=1 Tax=Verrucomicrobium sp. GAS474 TaxID=1882831 RepID=UPI0008797CF3|nr:bifunctional phosphoribosylaminoimidazolecarboxamide formyltransferase/IMP cyclohydrolase [Verrucomicrobium sp. GAS474]SDU15913.1 phosphoribosylaminoimidazolecarboxamide formyltransferase / IMP cyclohydrolase [Verrucomicrobium sp. GAS474]